MTQEDFKAMLLAALAEDGDFAEQVITSLADQFSLTLDTSEGYRYAGYLKVTLHLGQAKVSDFGIITVPSPCSHGPYA